MLSRRSEIYRAHNYNLNFISVKLHNFGFCVMQIRRRVVQFSLEFTVLSILRSGFKRSTPSLTEKVAQRKKPLTEYFWGLSHKFASYKHQTTECKFDCHFYIFTPKCVVRSKPKLHNLLSFAVCISFATKVARRDHRKGNCGINTLSIDCSQKNCLFSLEGVWLQTKYLHLMFRALCRLNDAISLSSFLRVISMQILKKQSSC